MRNYRNLVMDVLNEETSTPPKHKDIKWKLDKKQGLYTAKFNKGKVDFEVWWDDQDADTIIWEVSNKGKPKPFGADVSRVDSFFKNIITLKDLNAR